MAVEIEAEYTGELHCQLVHGPSGATLKTDAPVDNHGKGQAFSPTDLLATSLLSCMLTTLAIKAPTLGIEIPRGAGRVRKHMTTAGQRRIARLEVDVRLPSSIPAASRPDARRVLEQCPVALSLASAVEIELTASYDL